jgi:hypothetical protein
MNDTSFFKGKTVVGIVAMLVIVLAVAGCGRSSKKDKQASKEAESEQKGSLSRTFFLVDEQGRKSGTLVMHPSGNAELRDENDQVIGKFTFSGTTAEQPAVTASEAEPGAETEATEAAAESAESEAETEQAAAESEESEAEADDKAQD